VKVLPCPIFKKEKSFPTLKPKKFKGAKSFVSVYDVSAKEARAFGSGKTFHTRKYMWGTKLNSQILN
jgi:hypothetical protein